LQGLNVEEIKSYNNSLRQHKERVAKLQAEVEYNKAELLRLSKELSDELGIEVTPENLEQIYNERVERINNMLETGREILKQIADEESNIQL